MRSSRVAYSNLSTRRSRRASRPPTSPQRGICSRADPSTARQPSAEFPQSLPQSVRLSPSVLKPPQIHLREHGMRPVRCRNPVLAGLSLRAEELTRTPDLRLTRRQVLVAHSDFVKGIHATRERSPRVSPRVWDRPQSPQTDPNRSSRTSPRSPNPLKQRSSRSLLRAEEGTRTPDLPLT